MRWFWSATCISLSNTPITSSGGWYMSIDHVYACGTYVCMSVCVYNRMCEFVFTALNSQSQPRQTLFSHYWVSFFFFSFDVYLQAKNRAFPTVLSVSICSSLTLKNRRKRSQNENAHRRIQRFTGWERLLFYLRTLHWQQKRRFNYFGIDALVTKYRHFYSFVYFHFCFHLLICSWNKSQSFDALTTYVCVPVQKKR